MEKVVHALNAIILYFFGSKRAFQEDIFIFFSIFRDSIDDLSGGPFSSLFQQFVNPCAISLFYSSQLFPICRGISQPILSREAAHGASHRNHRVGSHRKSQSSPAGFFCTWRPLKAAGDWSRGVQRTPPWLAKRPSFVCETMVHAASAHLACQPNDNLFRCLIY